MWYILVAPPKNPSHRSWRTRCFEGQECCWSACSAPPISACEGTADIVIHPEFDLSYSFESGLEQWSGDGVDLFDPIVTWSAERTGQQASVGGSSVQLSLDNANGVAKIWIERGFTVDPSRAYNVDMSFDIGTADSGQADS